LNFLIVGAGAIGCLVGGNLATAGHAVTLVGRPRFVETVRDHGLVLTDASGSRQIRDIEVVGSLAEAYNAVDRRYDLIVLTVKSYDTDAALAELQAAIQAAKAPSSVILSLQNGVGNEEALVNAWGSAQVLAGVITTPVSIATPGIIQIERPSYFIGLSAWHPAMPRALQDATEHALQEAGFTVVVYPEAQGMKWTKLLMNLVGNATSAILDEPPLEIFADPTLVDLELEAWRETLRVMNRGGIAPVNLGHYPFRWLAPLIRWLPKSLLRGIFRTQVSGARGKKMPSLHIDLSAGKKRSEVGWLNGAVAQKGKELGIATPVNQMLTDILQMLMADEAQRALWRHDHLRLALLATEYRERRSEIR
jgi:2-dehydropantoate 2-reductase